MEPTGTIRAIQSALSSELLSFNDIGDSAAEVFATMRATAKFERPSSKLNTMRRKDAWREWIEFDLQLGPTGLYQPNWAIAKIWIAKILAGFRLGTVSFTNGSEFVPTFGENSIEAKLSKSVWTCTFDNFDFWASSCYKHRGLKMATRKRFAKLLATYNLNLKTVNRQLYNHFKGNENMAYDIFCFKLWHCTTMVQGNRFSTVPKNNIKDRPICVEPLANILTQRRVGIGIRNSLKNFGIDLDTLAEKHRVLISDPTKATIDLKNASDSISTHLVKYLLPKWVLRYIEESRSAMTLGLDDDFHIINKVSSMGNGFTFELMSLILTAVSRTFDPNSTVFGDDIIISSSKAGELVSCLQSVGFVVNMSKTHIDSEYRESCGAHYHDSFGYIESYDIKWPNTIHDCVVIANKVSRLSALYPSFRRLEAKVYRALPVTLYTQRTLRQGARQFEHREPFTVPVDKFVRYSSYDGGVKPNKRIYNRIRAFCSDIQENPRGSVMSLGFEWVDARSAPLVVHPTNWAKIMMYLASGRRCAATLKGKGAYKSFWIVTLKNGRQFRLSEMVSIPHEGK